MKNEYEIIPTAWVMKPKNKPIYDSVSISVEIADQFGGGYLEIRSHQDNLGEGEIQLDVSDWAAFKTLIETAIKQCKKYNDETENV